MATPKDLTFGANQRSGVQVVYTKSRRALSVRGWYDGFVGIEGGEVSLATFLNRLGITAQDCARALTDA